MTLNLTHDPGYLNILVASVKRHALITEEPRPVYCVKSARLGFMLTVLISLNKCSPAFLVPTYLGNAPTVGYLISLPHCLNPSAHTACLITRVLHLFAAQPVVVVHLNLAHLVQSSPSKPHANSPSSSSVGSFRTLTINFQKLYNKREAFWSLVDATKPDITFGCETWLNPSISQGEIFPPGYNLYRKDCKDSYGGVLLGIHDSLISHQVEVEPDVEFVAAKIISGKQNFVVGAAYRPPSSKQPYMDSINLVIESLCISNPGAAVWIGGDFNLPDIDWPTDQIIGHQYPLRLNDSFLQVLARTGLEQIVHFPTHLDNTLDLVLTNRPSLVNRCEGLPGIGDHDVVFADFNTQARRQKPVRHIIHLWKRADFNLIQSETKCGQIILLPTTQAPLRLKSCPVKLSSTWRKPSNNMFPPR